METINPSMRLKVKGDTFFLPDTNGDVYFRNNEYWFRIEGGTIGQWLEKLMPAFNGESTLQDLTDGLADEYREQVFDIAEILYQNGFVRDVSQDIPHQLSEEALQRYAAQIEFLDNLGGSGAYRFQLYRQSSVLVIGSGPFLVSLVRSLLESGTQSIHMLITNSTPTNRERLKALEAHARKTDPDVSFQEVALQTEGNNSWREALSPFQFVLYVSETENIEELRALHTVCRDEEKVLIPAICVHQVGLAGPLVHPDAVADWESAWRRLHRLALDKDPEFHTFSSTAGAMLANVIVFQLLQEVAGLPECELDNALFLLNLETLEANWHPILPHPLVVGTAKVQRVEDIELEPLQSFKTSDEDDLLLYFRDLTSKAVGILHTWEEGDLNQLPLAQCAVQVVDPLSPGPADLMPYMIRTGLTHEEARREAGLAGIETYAARLAGGLISESPIAEQTAADRLPLPEEFVGVGAGETVAEGVLRGLQKCLANELRKQSGQVRHVHRVQPNVVEDDHCRFYLQSLTTMDGVPQIALGDDVVGFPTVWVGTSDLWYGSVGLNVTMALRTALAAALSNHTTDDLKSEVNIATGVMEVPSVFLVDAVAENIVIAMYDPNAQTDLVREAIQILKQNRRQLVLFDLALEPFLKELAGVFGVVLREEGAQ